MAHSAQGPNIDAPELEKAAQRAAMARLDSAVSGAVSPTPGRDRQIRTDRKASAGNSAEAAAKTVGGLQSKPAKWTLATAAMAKRWASASGGMAPCLPAARATAAAALETVASPANCGASVRHSHQPAGTGWTFMAAALDKRSDLCNNFVTAAMKPPESTKFAARAPMAITTDGPLML